MRADSEFEFEFLSEESISSLNFQQKVLYAELRSDFIEWLREKGKKPRQNIGFKDSNIRPLSRRVHQVFKFGWKNGRLVLELTPELADEFIEALNQDKFTKSDNEPYKLTSKRKFANSLETYFKFAETDWSPDVEFSDGEPSFDSDPFNQRERESLLNAAFEHESPPNYTNLSPEERDRWKSHLAQYLGKPKDEITRSDWEELRHSWKIPALISTALDAGWRAEMVGRLKTIYLDLDNNQIIIPGEVAVKNDKKWTVSLSDRSVKLLEKWLDQRKNKNKYDDSDLIWLNRKSNPYNSKNLNDLLGNLMEEAGIEPNGRRLTWHSIRHSTGMYIYDSKNDLALVTEILRHKSLEAARKYAHPTPETKKDAIESIQGGAPQY